MMVEAFICHVAGHGGTLHGGGDAPPSLPQTPVGFEEVPAPVLEYGHHLGMVFPEDGPVDRGDGLQLQDSNQMATLN